MGGSMDLIESAQVLVPALCGLNVAVFGPQGAAAAQQAFAQRYAFCPAAQPLFTADGLRDFCQKQGAQHIYLLRDALETCAVLLKIGVRWLVLGPYVDTPWNETRAKVLLARCAAGDAALLPYKAYRCALPLLGEEYVVRLAALLLTNTVGNPPREVETIDLAARTAEDLPPRINDAYTDFDLVNRRYAWEDELTAAVRGGHTARALALLQDMGGLMTGIRFLTGNSIGDHIAGTMGLRVLVRHGALQAGLTPVFVDALSQEYAQRMHRAADAAQLDELTKEYIAAFCRAVRANRKLDYSPHVRQAVQYIELHLDHPLTMQTLCALCGISRQRLGALFQQETGGTVKQYIMRARCARAAELLRNSQLQVQEIGRYVGYEDTAYFARVFKSVVGLTPQAYRSKNKIS